MTTYAQASRNSLEITAATWKALFLRESIARLFSARIAWFWLLAEPVVHITYIAIIFSAIRVRAVGGIETGLWIAVGMVAFLTFRRTAIQMMNAINANKALFTYRQVKPVDTVIVRGALEGFVMIVVIITLYFLALLLDLAVVPDQPMTVMKALLYTWGFAAGFGLIASAASELVAELGNLLKLLMMPLYLLSGILFPISLVPLPYREWLMYNPIAHGVELARLGFADYYHPTPELSETYLFRAALVTIFMGLLLHRRFAQRLATL